jgi:hypothetical protein
MFVPPLLRTHASHTNGSSRGTNTHVFCIFFGRNTHVFCVFFIFPPKRSRLLRLFHFCTETPTSFGADLGTLGG